MHVVWVTYNKGTIARGYWDQGMLEDLFAGRWHVPGWPNNIVHLEGFDALPEGDGAIVVLPARHNAERITELQDDLDRLSWCVLILTGDEESIFPWEKISHPNMRLWLMSPVPGLHPDDGTIQYLGSGYPPQARQWYRDLGFLTKDIDFFFSGQVTHDRREECIAALQGKPGVVVATEGFTLGLSHEDYYRNMARARFAPAPSGPVSVDSFRLYEALEAGSIPVADTRTPTVDMTDHWEMVFDDIPLFPMISEWSTIGDVCVTADPAFQNRLGSWWELQKRKLAVRLTTDLEAVGVPAPEVRVSDVLSIVMVTSPISSHPSTDVIDETIASIRCRPELADCEIFVLCDGVRPEQEHYRHAYEGEYLSRLLWKSRNEWTNVYPVMYQAHTHQARMTRSFLQAGLLRTPAMLFMEHDTPLVGDISFRATVDAVLDGFTDVVRFHHEAVIPEEHLHLYPAGFEPVEFVGHPFVHTIQWSQRPHLATASFYRAQLEQHFSDDCVTMIEDVMHSVAQDPEWSGRIHVYYPPGNCQRSTHTDGRGTDPKYEMVL